MLNRVQGQGVLYSFWDSEKNVWEFLWNKLIKWGLRKSKVPFYIINHQSYPRERPLGENPYTGLHGVLGVFSGKHTLDPFKPPCF